MLNIQLFGHFRLSIGENTVSFNAPPRTLPLLAYLLLNRNEIIPRQSLSFLLWPDDSEESARANLRRHLHWLRQSLPTPLSGQPWLYSDAKSLQWNTSADYWLDVADFEQYCATEENLPRAVELYQGDLLNDLYDDWILDERERLRERFFYCLEHMVQRHRLQHNYSQAIFYARRWLAHDPLREDILRQLVALRYEAGDRAGAVEEYENFRQQLHTELGVNPMPETITLFEAILRDEALPQSITTPPSSLPLSTSVSSTFYLPFIGRAREMQILQTSWHKTYSSHGGLALISGEAGIGKTRLVSEFAFMVESHGGRVLRGATLPSELVPYQSVIIALRSALPMLTAIAMTPIRLAALSLILPELIARRVSHGESPLPLPRLDAEQERERLFDALAYCLESLARPRPLLLILEDMQWAGSATLALLEYLAHRVGEKSVLILATYQEEETPLNHPLRGLRRRLQSKGLLTQISLSRLSLQDIGDLFIRQTDPKDNTAILVERLFSLSEGNPLFLRELIHDLVQAGILYEREGIWQAKALPDEFYLPENLNNLISERLTHLSSPALSLAETASVIGQVFDIELVANVVGWQEQRVLDHLDKLLDQQIIRETAGGGHFQFSFGHELIRKVIYQSMPDDVRKRRHHRIGHVIENLRVDDLDAFAGELAHHFELGGDAEHAALYYERTARHALDMNADEEALNASQRSLDLSTDARRLFDLLAFREEIFHRRGERSAQDATLKRLASQAQSLGDDELECEVLRRRIRYHSQLGERAIQEKLITELKTHKAVLSKTRWNIEALLAESSFQAQRAKYKLADSLAHQALSLSQQIGDYSGQLSANLILVDVATQRWDIPTLQVNLKNLTALVEEHSDQGTLVKSLRAASSAAFSRQEFDVSQRLSQQMLDLCKRIGDREGQADAHTRLAMVAARLFHIEEARQHYSQASDLYEQVMKRQGQASVLLNNGLLLARLGRYTECREAFIHAASMFEEMGDVRGQAICALNQCAIAIYQEDFAEAQTQAHKCLDIAHKGGLGAIEALSLGNLGEIALREEKPRQAVRYLKKAISSRHKLGIPEVVSVMDLATLLEAYLSSGDLQCAQQSAENLWTLYQANPQNIEYPQYVLWVLSLFYRAVQDTRKADEYLTQAYDMLQQRAAIIPDKESQTSFLKMPHNRRILDAYQRNMQYKSID